jgi:hypothetical protein
LAEHVVLADGFTVPAILDLGTSASASCACRRGYGRGVELRLRARRADYPNVKSEFLDATFISRGAELKEDPRPNPVVPVFAVVEMEGRIVVVPGPWLLGLRWRND